MSQKGEMVLHTTPKEKKQLAKKERIYNQHLILPSIAVSANTKIPKIAD
jgi:hypothetical protein